MAAAADCHWRHVGSNCGSVRRVSTKCRYVALHRQLIADMNSVTCLTFLARYVSRLCYDANVHLSVRLSMMEVHWCIIANLGFKFRSHFTVHCGRLAAGGRRAACGWIISHRASQC